MDINEMKQDFKDSWNNPEVQEAWADTKPFLGNAAVCAYFLAKSKRALKRGETQKAIYYAILWVGFSNNTANSYAQYMAKKRSKAARPRFVTNFN